ADLVQRFVAQAIEPAVAGPYAGIVLAVGKERDDGAGDDPAGTTGGGLAPQFPVGSLQRRLDAGEERRRALRRWNLPEGGDGKLAGVVAGIVTAHAVGDRPQPEIGAVEIGILVQLADTADMGSRARNEVEPRCRGRR